MHARVRTHARCTRLLSFLSFFRFRISFSRVFVLVFDSEFPRFDYFIIFERLFSRHDFAPLEIRLESTTIIREVRLYDDKCALYRECIDRSRPAGRFARDEESAWEGGTSFRRRVPLTRGIPRPKDHRRGLNYKSTKFFFIVIIIIINIINFFFSLTTSTRECKGSRPISSVHQCFDSVDYAITKKDLSKSRLTVSFANYVSRDFVTIILVVSKDLKLVRECA